MDNKYWDFIEQLEDARKTEKEIINVLEKILVKCGWEKDECHNMNDVLIWKGYKYRFLPLSVEKKEFNRFEYATLVKGIGKSQNQTLKLMSYLRNINDFRLTFSSMHFIKIKYLIQSNLMKINNPLLQTFANSNLYDTYFSCIHNMNDENCKHIIEHINKNILPLMGEKYAYQNFDYKNFEIDMEYLLYTINLLNLKDAYKRINTIKVALNINEPDWHIWGIDTIKMDICKTKKEQENIIDKGTYYYKNIVKELMPSLHKINKDVAKKIAKKYEGIYEKLQDNGYKILYMLICQ